MKTRLNGVGDENCLGFSPFRCFWELNFKIFILIRIKWKVFFSLGWSVSKHLVTALRSFISMLSIRQAQVSVQLGRRTARVTYVSKNNAYIVNEGLFLVRRILDIGSVWRLFKWSILSVITSRCFNSGVRLFSYYPIISGGGRINVEFVFIELANIEKRVNVCVWWWRLFTRWYVIIFLI